MAKDVDLTSREWRDIVFEGKNKDFGAYKLRESSPARHTKAIVWVVISVAIILVLLILSVSGVFSKPEEEQITTATVQEIAAVEAEEEEIEEEEEQFQMPEPEEVVAPEEVANQHLVTAMVEQKPEFNGGEAAMYKWLSENIVYPSAASEQGVQGRVVVEFVVGKDGSITNVRVLRPRHPALDKEAVRVVKAMPKWIPGRNNGQPVKVTYTLPVTFKLQ